MKKSFTIIYTILASLIIIFAISFFGVNIYNENQHGELRTQVRFEKMAQAVITSINKTNITSSELSRQIDNAIGDTKDFAFIKIVSNGKTLYLFPENYSDAEAVQSNLILTYKKTGAQNIQINAGLYSLRPGTIFNYAKISFFIILIVALVTVILILFTNQFSSEKSSSTKKRTYKIIQDEEDDEDEDEDNDKEDEFDEEEDIEEDDDEQDKEPDNDKPVDESNTNQEVKEETVEKIEKVTEPEKPAETPEPVKTPAAELPVNDFKPVELEENNTERGLFSEDTGLGWESYLMTRLENELNRATASELDLSLFIIKIIGITRKNPIMKKICEYLTVEFQFKDMLFEYKDDSICALKLSMNIDDAITFAEKLQSEIKAKAAEENIDVYIGITSRGIRMVSGERLLKEADEAIIHAHDDKDCPVVGFRADAAKYRKFIESN